MIIRVLSAQDVSSYWDIRSQALNGNPEAFLTTYEDYVTRPLEQVASQLAPSDHHFTLGAFTDSNGLVGTVTLVREQRLKVRHIANVFAMYVSLDARRQGVGRRLLAELVRRARQLEGVEQLRLSVVQDNAAALGLYESVGFYTYGIEPNALKTAERAWDEVLMVLSFVGERQLAQRNVVSGGAAGIPTAGTAGRCRPRCVPHECWGIS